MGIDATTARYVPGGGEAWRDPWPSYSALREHDPVHHVVPRGRPDEDFYVLSRHADVLAAAVDTETFSSASGVTVTYGELERIGLADNPPFVMTDPPVHTAFRRLVARGFTPRQVAELEPAEALPQVRGDAHVSSPSRVRRTLLRCARRGGAPGGRCRPESR
jgi:cytochrome P450